MLDRGIREPQIKPFSEDLLRHEPQKQDQMFLSEIKEESPKKITLENEEKELSDEFVFIEDEKIKEKNKEIVETPLLSDVEKQKSPLRSVEHSEIHKEKEEIKDEEEIMATKGKSKEDLLKKINKSKEKNILKKLKLAQNEQKLKIVESIASSSDNSSTKVVKKNFLHLIKSRNLPFSLKVISFLGYLGFIGLAVTFSVLYSLLYQSFQDLNDNIINIMFGHHFARPLGFVVKGIEQKIVLENFYPNLPDKTSRYDDIQLLMESLGDYEYSYLQLVNMNVKFQYQYVFMNTDMSLKLYNLDQDPTVINLVLIHL